jgi:hypothetical protein
MHACAEFGMVWYVTSYAGSPRALCATTHQVASRSACMQESRRHPSSLVACVGVTVASLQDGTSNASGLLLLGSCLVRADMMKPFMASVFTYMGWMGSAPATVMWVVVATKLSLV